MKHKAKITISRPSFGDGQKLIQIRVYDVDARVEFLELSLSFNAFAEMMTGLANTECVIELRGIENVGKLMEKKRMEFILPKGRSHTSKKEVAAEAKKHTPDGWEPPTYFGSRDSFFTKGGDDYAVGNMLRWVDK